MTTKQHIHFIGICGVAMSALALAFKRKGWKVTGSDVGFYPPVSTHLKNAGVDYYAGWHVDKMTAGGIPDLIVIGNVAGSHNPEWLYVQEKKLNYKSYPEVIKEYFIKKNSIVCAGTYGKTTSTALLTWILKEANYNPSYMFGGIMISPSFQEGAGGVAEERLSAARTTATPSALPLGKGEIQVPAAAMTDSDWSVVEGDEYKASRWDNGPKFAYYSPTHLLLTSVVWDHADVYPTEKEYIVAFKKLFDSVPENGLKVISEKALPIVIPTSQEESLAHETIGQRSLVGASLTRDDSKMVTYGKNPTNNYVYTNIVQDKNGISFTIIDKISNIQYPIFSSCLGDYMADNITGCFALAHQIGIAPEKIIEAIKTFKSLKRRLEKRLDKPVAIFDDIAHSPSKATAIIKTLRQIYSGRVYAIFEPNTGNRQHEAIPAYDNAFADADEMIIPRLTKIKIKADEKNLPLDGDELAKIISATHADTTYIDDDEGLIDYLQQKIQPGDVVVFMGSHGFRGMIERLIGRVSL